MEAHDSAAGQAPLTSRLPAWALGLIPLVLIVVAIGSFVALSGPGLGDRNGVPVEDLSVERAVLHPGEIELIVRNQGPDPVTISQVSVNDAYVGFSSDSTELDRLDSTKLTIPYDWIEGENYEIFLLTSTGGTFNHTVEAAAETPAADAGFLGLMALLGFYVGVIPVSLGMLWLPFVRRVGEHWMRIFMAVTVGLLFFLAVDATVEGAEIAGQGAAAFGGLGLLVLGATLAYLALAAIDVHMKARRASAKRAGAGGAYMALLVAIGIGLHNLGEGLAIGSAYALGALALGTFLVVGFAIHNTTEGFAIIAPMSHDSPSMGRLIGLGLIAGSPAILGAWIGASNINPAFSTLMLGAGVGAIVQVIQQLAPSVRDASGRFLYPASVAGLAAGVLLLYLTGLLVST